MKKNKQNVKSTVSEDSKTRIDKIVKAIQETADILGIHPSEVTSSQLYHNSPGINNWMIRSVGGLSGVRAAHFPLVSKDLATIREQKEVAKYIKSLENKVADIELSDKRLLEGVSQLILPRKVQIYKPKTSKIKERRYVVGMLNDTHYGLSVNAEEVGETNRFSWVEACRRTALFTKQAIEYKANKRDETEVFHLVLNGDIVSGVIHDLTARTSELLIHQVNGALHILTHVVENLAANYKNVVIHGVSGNHDDAIHRREGGRVLSHKYDSYANMIYYALSAAFRETPNVSFSFPKSLYGTIDLPTGRLMYTHGDTMFTSTLGNPGNTLNTKRLSDDISRFNNGEQEKNNQKIKMVLFGHVHTHTFFTTFDGVKVLIAPSLSGVDAYAASLAINHNQIGQMLFESTSSHLIGDMRLVNLIEADNDASLDQIIPIFNNGLEWKK